MNSRELKNGKRKQFRLWLSEEERKLLEVRAQQYGYQHLSEYLRDAGIYNDVVQIDISYTEAVNNLFQELINEVRQFTKETRRVLKYDTSASPEERDAIQQALYRVYSQTKSLKKSVNDNINVKEVIKTSKVKMYKNEVQKELDNILGNQPGSSIEVAPIDIDALIVQMKKASAMQNDNTSSEYKAGWEDCIEFLREMMTK